MPESRNAIYQHAPMTEAIISQGAMEDREVIIVEDFNPFSITPPDSDECIYIDGDTYISSANRYILSHEIQIDETTKVRRNFPSYEALQSIGENCSGATLINIDSHYIYTNITGGGGNDWSVQQAIEELDALAGGGGSGLKYLKDGGTNGSLVASDNTTTNSVSGAALFQYNLGANTNIMNNSLHSTTLNGRLNEITSANYSALLSGLENYILSPHSTILNARNSIIDMAGGSPKDSYATILNGKGVFVENKTETSIGASTTETTYDGQSSRLVVNGSTEDGANNPDILYLVNDLGARIPLKGAGGTEREGGSISGTIIVSGLYVHGTDSDGSRLSSTVVSQYIFSAVVAKNGPDTYDLNLADMGHKSQSETSGATPVDIVNLEFLRSGNEAYFRVESSVTGKVSWTATMDVNRIVGDISPTPTTTAPPPVTVPP